MSGVLVSVVVSTRNRCQVLGAALDALLDQRSSGVPYEVLVVDNASSDATASLVRAFEDRVPDIVRYLFERRPGVSNGRNAGITASRGSIVAFTDDDVLVASGWLSQGARQLLANPRIAYVGGPVVPRWTAAPPSWLNSAHWSPIAAVDYGSEPFEVPTTRPVCLISANLFVRRSALDRVGLFNTAFRRCQDHELMLRFWAAGLKGLYAPDVRASTIVPRERLTRRYHRRWHRTHGQFLARMPYRERRTDGRWIVEPSTRGGFLLGAPLFEYRALMSHLAGWVRAVAEGRRQDAFRTELQLRYSSAFILTSILERSRAAIARFRNIRD